jgi:hypothetical protein
MTERTDPGTSPVANGSAKWNAPTGRRTDEWSEALVLIGDSQDRAAFTRFFRHFAPLIKAFALSGSSLSATHADDQRNMEAWGAPWRSKSASRLSFAKHPAFTAHVFQQQLG